jgi:hypothetical protein
MSFLAPLFLVALGALAIPVLIHLTQRERKQIVQFPSLMFLRRIPFPSVRRRRIRDWILLAMRLAALLLIVAAFARPFVRRPTVALAGPSGPREVVILLDHSYSMAYGNHWERARSAARSAAGALGAEDRATLILFAAGAELDVRSTTDRGPLLAAIDAARVSALGTRYGPALKLAQRILIESKLASREVVLISDYQKIGWNREEDLRLPEGARLTPVSVAEANTANVTVSTVMLQRAGVAKLERVTASAGLVNRSATPISNLQVQLEIDGRQIQARPVTIPANGSASITFEPFTLAGPNTRATVRTPPDRLPADDAFHVVLSPVRPLPVLVVEPDLAARDASLYLNRALGIGSAPPFRVDIKPAGQVAAADLDGPQAGGSEPRVVILNDVAFSGSRAAQLRRFVERGGGLLVVLGERAAWPPEARDWLPGLPGALVDNPPGRGGMLGEIDYSHPIFELFKAPRSGDFSSARFFRHRAVTVDSGPQTSDPARAVADRVSVVARFDDGTPALIERSVGQGRALLWASTLDNFWNDLVLRPVFLPFLHQVVTYLARYQEPVPWFTVGQVVDTDAVLRAEGYSPESGAATQAGVVLTPSGQRAPLPGADRTAPLELTESGFYEIHVRSGKEDRPLALAANIDPAESDLSPLDPQELVAAVAGPGGTRSAGAADTTQWAPEDQERRQAVWWYLLLAGIVTLGIETAVSNRLSRTGP